MMVPCPYEWIRYWSIGLESMKIDETEQLHDSRFHFHLINAKSHAYSTQHLTKGKVKKGKVTSSRLDLDQEYVTCVFDA